MSSRKQSYDPPEIQNVGELGRLILSGGEILDDTDALGSG